MDFAQPKVLRSKCISVQNVSYVEQALYALQRNAISLANSYNGWYSYIYDGNATSILDGGRDMFDVGNIVSIFLSLLHFVHKSILSNNLKCFLAAIFDKTLVAN